MTQIILISDRREILYVITSKTFLKYLKALIEKGTEKELIGMVQVKAVNEMFFIKIDVRTSCKAREDESNMLDQHEKKKM